MSTASEVAMTSSPSVSELVYLLDEAFEGVQWHSLVHNVGAVDPQDWTWIPSGGDRSVKDIVEHVGVCKIMYDNHAFGDGKLSWDDQLVEDENALLTIPTAIEWLRSCHAKLRGSVVALTDEELNKPRGTHAGTQK